jgi:hypothetical protein
LFGEVVDECSGLVALVEGAFLVPESLAHLLYLVVEVDDEAGLFRVKVGGGVADVAGEFFYGRERGVGHFSLLSAVCGLVGRVDGSADGF